MVILDFDGVLGDTEAAARRCAEALITQAGLQRRPFANRAALRLTFTPRVLAEELGQRGAETLVGFHPIAMRSWAQGCRLHEGIPGFLRKLKKPPPIITAGFGSTAEMILGSSRNLVGEILGHEHGAKTELLAEAVSHASAIGDIVVYVTDTRTDIERCRRVGAKVLAVTWGYDTTEELVAAEPDAVLSSPQELLRALESLDAAEVR